MVVDDECTFVIKKMSTTNRRRKDQVTRLCRECKKRESRDRYAKDPERVKAQVKDWQKNNRKRINDRFKERYEKDPVFAETRRSRQRRVNMTPEQVEQYRATSRIYIKRPDVKARRKAYASILRAAGASANKQQLEIARIKKIKPNALLWLAWANNPDPRIAMTLTYSARLKRAEAREKALRLKASLTYEELDYLQVVAPLPLAAIRPILVAVLAGMALHQTGLSLSQEAQRRRWLKGQYVEGDELIGVGRLEAISGITGRAVFRMFDGEQQSMALHIADQIFMYTEYDLNELVDVAAEWAALTGDPWPIGYMGVAMQLAYFRRENGDVAA